MHRPPYFHLTFRPNLTLVSTVRRFIGDFYRRVLVDQELASRVALATHELLENAVAYAADEETEVRIEVEGDVLAVRTWNRTTPERIVALKATIDEMSSVSDPDSFYQTMLARTAKRTDGSGLGLARIRAEAEMRLGYEIDDNRVCILATATIVGGLNS